MNISLHRHINKHKGKIELFLINFCKYLQNKCYFYLTLFFPIFPLDPLENISKTFDFQKGSKGTLGRKGLTDKKTYNHYVKMHNLYPLILQIFSNSLIEHFEFFKIIMLKRIFFNVNRLKVTHNKAL